MRELVILFVHALATLARLLGPGGIRSVVAESVLVKQQLLILNRSRLRSPNLRTSDRLVAGLCALLIRPARLIRSAIVLRPSTLLSSCPSPKRGSDTFAKKTTAQKTGVLARSWVSIRDDHLAWSSPCAG